MVKMIRGWRVRSEGPGVFIWFDPSIEHVVLHEGGMEVAYEVREGREASEAGAISGQYMMDGIAECDISAIRKGGVDEPWPE